MFVIGVKKDKQFVGLGSAETVVSQNEGLHGLENEAADFVVTLRREMNKVGAPIRCVGGHGLIAIVLQIQQSDVAVFSLSVCPDCCIDF